MTLCLDLARAINAEHAAAVTAGQTALQHARRAGELLTHAKQQIAHGEWLSWLAGHCPEIRERTAQAYMRIAREWSALDAKAQRVADLPVREALALLAEPRAHDTDWAAGCRRQEQIGRCLAVLRAALCAENLELAELTELRQQAAAYEAEAFEIRVRAEREVGRLLVWADSQGLGAALQGLATHPEQIDQFLTACDARIAELQHDGTAA